SAVSFYIIASEKDSLRSNKEKYAEAIAGLYKKLDDFKGQAIWLGKVYQWKEKTNNLDLFNWGIANYKALNYQGADSVFALYTSRYPEDIFGYYWRAQSNAGIDTAMTDSLSVPYYRKVVLLGEKD